MSPGLELMRGWEEDAEKAELPKGARVLQSWGQLGHGLESWNQWYAILGGFPVSMAPSCLILFTPTRPLLLSHKSLYPVVQSCPSGRVLSL